MSSLKTNQSLYSFFQQRPGVGHHFLYPGHHIHLYELGMGINLTAASVVIMCVPYLINCVDTPG